MGNVVEKALQKWRKRLAQKSVKFDRNARVTMGIIEIPLGLGLAGHCLSLPTPRPEQSYCGKARGLNFGDECRRTSWTDRKEIERTAPGPA